MSMTKVQLLADAALLYKSIVEVKLFEVVGDVSWYNMNIFEVGTGTTDRKPTALRRNIQFYVYKEGTVDEEAYYGQADPINTVNTDIASTSATLLSYDRIYESTNLRQRILGWIINKAMAVGAEDPSVLHHSMRLKWAKDVIKDPNKYLNIFMCYISQSEEVRIDGNAVSDVNLLWLSYMVNAVAEAYGFTD